MEVFTLTHSLTAQVESFFENFYSFYTADEKLCEYEKILVKNLKTRQDKLIQSQTPGQHTKNQDCPGKTGTVGMFASHNFTTSKA